MFNEETHLEMDFCLFGFGPTSLELIRSEFFLGFRLQIEFIGTCSKWKAVTTCLPDRHSSNNLECVSLL